MKKEEREKIIADLNKSTDELMENFSSFPEKYFTIKPSETGWSAAEIGEHLVMFEKFVVIFLNGETKSKERSSAERISTVHQAFQDLEKKYVAPATVIPSGKLTDKNEIISRLKSAREKIIEAIATHDLNLICATYRHFAFGELSKLEWIYFTIHHSERHLHQLKNLFSKLQTNSAS